MLQEIRIEKAHGAKFEAAYNEVDKQKRYALLDAAAVEAKADIDAENEYEVRNFGAVIEEIKYKVLRRKSSFYKQTY